jgi:hypothetical protein
MDLSRRQDSEAYHKSYPKSARDPPTQPRAFHIEEGYERDYRRRSRSPRRRSITGGVLDNSRPQAFRTKTWTTPDYEGRVRTSRRDDLTPSNPPFQPPSNESRGTGNEAAQPIVVGDIAPFASDSERWAASAGHHDPDMDIDPESVVSSRSADAPRLQNHADPPSGTTNFDRVQGSLGDKRFESRSG